MKKVLFFLEMRDIQASIAANLIRWFVALSMQRTNWWRQLARRASSTEIGLTGHVSMIDDKFAKAKKVQSLNRFEKWLIEPFIEDEKMRRQEMFREACIEVLGEDPDEWR